MDLRGRMEFNTGKRKKAVKVVNPQHSVRNNLDLYALLLPGILLIFIFKYIPMYGIVIAFQDFNIFKGIAGSTWVGLKHFSTLFTSDGFYRVLINTLLISSYKIVFLFPIPIIVALLLNEIKKAICKKFVQTVIYLPHFISWVIVCGMFITLLSPSSGFMKFIIGNSGDKPIILLTDRRFFRGLMVIIQGWKEVGWGTIVYLAAITGVDPQMYEAATIDGAGRLRKMWNITLPSITPTIIMLLILRMGSVLDAGTEQILLFYSPIVYDVADVIGTFVYRMGLGKLEYSFSTAVGLFNSLVGFILIISANKISRKYASMSIW